MTRPVAGRTAAEVLADAAAVATATGSRAGVTIRPLETLQQMDDACAVLRRVWDIGPGQMFDVSRHLLRAFGHGGNYLFGAYPVGEQQPIGASVCFFTEPLGAAMHSHITGVLPGTAGKGVGGALKWHQRQWALERGLSRVTWTYDPLIARNSFFNLTRLGARPEAYFVDFYGLMDDGPNRGQPSDRSEIVWDLTSGPTIAAERATLAGGPGPTGPDVDALISAGAAVLLSVGSAGEPVVAGPPPAGAQRVLLGIPTDIEQLRRTDPATALAWRYELRAALSSLLPDPSWQVTGFAKRGWYLLERREPA
ncbi:MAG: GNAT family N-acetyltransferase [Nakamurella sp.]